MPPRRVGGQPLHPIYPLADRAHHRRVRQLGRGRHPGRSQDLSAIGVYGASVITAITAQNTQGVQGVFCLPQEIIAQQMRSVASDLVVGGIKTGMLGDRATVETVTAGLAALAGVPVVVDPVIVATSSDVRVRPERGEPGN